MPTTNDTPLNPNGTTVSLNFDTSWHGYHFDKIRFKCDAKWNGLEITSSYERNIFSDFNLSVEANEWYVVDLSLVWDEEHASGEGVWVVTCYRNPNDPTPGNAGSVLLDIECGPQEKPAS